MYSLENDIDGGFQTYSDAVWWTAMLLTTMGSDYFPQTGEGRMLCLILAVYGFAVFGYVTATLATFFINQDAEARPAYGEDTPALGQLREEIAELRRMLSERLPQG